MGLPLTLLLFFPSAARAKRIRVVHRPLIQIQDTILKIRTSLQNKPLNALLQNCV